MIRLSGAVPDRCRNFKAKGEPGITEVLGQRKRGIGLLPYNLYKTRRQILEPCRPMQANLLRSRTLISLESDSISLLLAGR